MTKHAESRLLDPPLLGRAAADSFRKLHPRHMARNPVMLVVEAGAVLATLPLVGLGTRSSLSFQLQVVLWLWATVLFANFADRLAGGAVEREQAHRFARRVGRRACRDRQHGAVIAEAHEQRYAATALALRTRHHLVERQARRRGGRPVQR
ncbi:MAG TPA: hypothetical protein PKA62_19805, partial [Thermoanaerobaculia bacterium]|nr:hypothetical protein [Thermoanaerobaculia bacterium]